MRVDEMADVYDFWTEQAKIHGQADTATAPDHFYRLLEINRIKQHLYGNPILDIGCGNGYSTTQFRLTHPASYVGVDYNKAMIEQARKADPSIMWMVADVRDLSGVHGHFKTIVCCRCLINLPNWEDQKQALLQMKEHLTSDGKIILVENFLDGLQQLNELRQQFDLHPIEVRWHNRYLLLDEFFDFVPQHFRVKLDQNIGNLYYLLSRVLYAKLAQLEGAEPQYDHVINELASQMPHVEGPYSANHLMILRP
jgi:ubiquinone/menaquinone biosynthesis C-methylase UbiE